MALSNYLIAGDIIFVKTSQLNRHRAIVQSHLGWDIAHGKLLNFPSVETALSSVERNFCLRCENWETNFCIDEGLRPMEGYTLSRALSKNQSRPRFLSELERKEPQKHCLQKNSVIYKNLHIEDISYRLNFDTSEIYNTNVSFLDLVIINTNGKLSTNQYVKQTDKHQHLPS